MKRMVSLTPERNSQRIAALANFWQRLQSRALSNSEGKLVRRWDDRDGPEWNRRGKWTRAALGERQVTGRIADRHLNFTASNLVNRRRSVAREESYSPMICALRPQAHARLALLPARLIDHFRSDFKNQA